MANRPLTAEEAKALIDTHFVFPLYDELWKLILEPRYQTVRYRAALDRVDYERPDTFYALGPVSPSDCVWMIPQ